MWTLITIPNPKPEEYTHEDYERYKELLYETNAFYRGYDTESNYHRANRSKKWKIYFTIFGKSLNEVELYAMTKRRIILSEKVSPLLQHFIR